MTEEQEVVIIGKDGKEHVFPQGFDPKKAAQIVSGVRDESTAQLGSVSEMAKEPRKLNMFPADPSTGKPLPMIAPKFPRGTLPVLAGMTAALATGGLSVPAQAAAALFAGSGGSGAESLMRGETPSIGNMAMEGAEQAAIAGLPGIGRVGANVGKRLAGFKAGKLTTLATAAPIDAALLKIGVPHVASEGAAWKAAEAITPKVEQAVNATGRASVSAGDAVANAAQKKTSGEVIGQMFGKPMYAKAGRVPVVGDALRKMQLLYRVLTGKQDEQ